MIDQQEILPKSTFLQVLMGDTKNMFFLLGISILMNLLLLCGISFVIYQRNTTPNIAITPIIDPLLIPTNTPKPNIPPQKNDDEIKNELEDCFRNCTDLDFIKTLEKQLEQIINYKSIIQSTNKVSQICNNQLNIVNSPNNEIRLPISSQGFCPEDFAEVNIKKEVRIDTDRYIYNESTKVWEQASVAKRIRPRIFDYFSTIKNQQKISSDYLNIYGTPTRILRGSSSVLSDNETQIVQKVTVYVDVNYKLIYIEQEIDEVIEQISFFDYNITNKIDKP
jgi:hypothetical protein